LRARYYDPTTGRFNRLDPFFGNQFDPQSFHKYLYTHTDPVNGVDPNGKYLLPIIFLFPHLAISVGAIASAPMFALAGGTFIAVNLLFSVFVNFNILMFSPIRSEIEGINFLSHYDELMMNNRSIYKTEVRDMLKILFHISSHTPPPINWIWNIWRQALSNTYHWTQGTEAPDINQVCGRWVDKVLESFKDSLKENGYGDAEIKFANMGIKFNKVIWDSYGGNQHVTLCIEIKKDDGKIEEWQLDDGWEFHLVGSPYERGTTNNESKQHVPIR
jgi:hypothetical protein